MSKLRYDRELLRAETKDLKKMNKKKENLLLHCQTELNEIKEKLFTIQSKKIYQRMTTNKKEKKNIEKLKIELRNIKSSTGKIKTRLATLLAVMLKPARGSVVCSCTFFT